MIDEELLQLQFKINSQVQRSTSSSTSTSEVVHHADCSSPELFVLRQQNFIMALRWGICSAGKISHDFACGLSTLDSSLHTIGAVAARSLENAKEFAELHKIPTAYGSYEELAADDNIDVIYIGSVNSAHRDLCLLFLNHNRNVICEKPLSLNVKQANEIISLAKEKDVFFMEAVWTRFFPVSQKIREIISSGQIGEVKLVRANFALPILKKERTLKKELGGGAAYDIGIYPLQLALMAFNDEEPTSVTVSGHLMEGGVDECGNITLLYPGNRMAALLYSGLCTLTNDAEIACTNGLIKIYSPCWCPTQMDVTNLETGKTDNFCFTLPTPRVSPNFDNSEGLRYEAEAVRQAIKEGKKEHALMSHKTSLLLASTLEKVRNSLGYVVEGDSVPK